MMSSPICFSCHQNVINKIVEIVGRHLHVHEKDNLNFPFVFQTPFLYNYPQSRVSNEQVLMSELSIGYRTYITRNRFCPALFNRPLDGVALALQFQTLFSLWRKAHVSIPFFPSFCRKKIINILCLSISECVPFYRLVARVFDYASFHGIGCDESLRNTNPGGNSIFYFFFSWIALTPVFIPKNPGRWRKKKTKIGAWLL